MIVGYLFAVLATVASGSGSILESIAVGRAGVFGGKSKALVGLWRQPIYFVGIGVDLLGFVLAAAALHRLPLFLVQALLAFSVGVTAAISSFLGARLAVRGWVALGVGAVGLAMLGVSAEPGPARDLPIMWRFVLLAMPVPVALFAIYARRHGGSWTPRLLAFGAGLAFCMVGVAARTLSGHLLTDPSAWALVVNGLTAAILFAMSLQLSGATAVTAIMFTTNTALSSLIGLIYLDDRVRAGFAPLAVAGFVCAVTGAIGAAHYASIAKTQYVDSDESLPA